MGRAARDACIRGPLTFSDSPGHVLLDHQPRSVLVLGAQAAHRQPRSPDDCCFCHVRFTCATLATCWSGHLCFQAMRLFWTWVPGGHPRGVFPPCHVTPAGSKYLDYEWFPGPKRGENGGGLNGRPRRARPPCCEIWHGCSPCASSTPGFGIPPGSRSPTWP